MAQVILHIGAHKTGTSYLQRLFHINRERLAAAELYYPDIGPNNAHHALGAIWVPTPGLPPTYREPGYIEGLWKTLVADYAKAPGTLFLSAENFTQISPNGQVDMVELAQRLAPFEDVRIVYTLRQQIELAQAVWLQVARKTRPPGIHGFMRKVLEQHMAGGVPTEHGIVYDWIRTGFAPEQITLLNYHEIRRAPGGIAQVFLDLMEADIQADTLAQPEPEDSNISPDPLVYLTAVRIMKQQVPPAELIATLTDIICPSPEQRTSLLARYEVDRFVACYTPFNAALVSRVQQYQPEFSFDPEPMPDTMIYREDLTEEQWISIAGALYRPPTLSTVMHRTRKTLGWTP